jgi:hypothetical protein
MNNVAFTEEQLVVLAEMRACLTAAHWRFHDRTSGNRQRRERQFRRGLPG